jgi:ubiquinone/menaquinone biosynthesis C-methylase UbiE
MNTPSVKYDQIAPTYDRRFDPQQRQPILSMLVYLVNRIQAQTILEVGCGTGFWLTGLEDAFAGQRALTCYGLDFSAGMLRQAHTRKPTLRLVHGQAEALPFGGASFDLIYCVHALHHFHRQQEFVSTCLNWLEPGGVLAVIGSDPHNTAASRRRGEWYVYQYFEGVLQTDLARFPSWGQVLDWMAGAGYEQITWNPIETIHDSWQGAEVFQDPFLKKEATSQLILTTDAAYQAGLERLQDTVDAAQTAGTEIEFHSIIHIDMLTGFKPPVRGR